MNSEGLCVTPLLHNWVTSSTCSQCISSLSSIFAIESPVRQISEEERSTMAVVASPPVPQHQPVTPSIVFDGAFGNNDPPGYSQASQQISRQSQLNQKLNQRYLQFSQEVNKNIDDALTQGEQLQNHAARLDSYQSALQQDIVNQNKGVEVFTQKTAGLQKWIVFESKAQQTRSAEDMLQCDPLSSQYVIWWGLSLVTKSNLGYRLLDAVASDAAYEDCLFVLRQELHQNKIDFDNFLKVNF